MSSPLYWVERRTTKTARGERWTLESGYSSEENAAASASWFRREYHAPARVIQLSDLGCFTIRIGSYRVVLHANTAEEAITRACS